MLAQNRKFCLVLIIICQYLPQFVHGLNPSGPLVNPQFQKPRTSISYYNTAIGAVFSSGREDDNTDNSESGSIKAKRKTSSKGLSSPRMTGEDENQKKTAEELREEALKSVSRCRYYAFGAGMLSFCRFVFDNHSALQHLNPIQWVDLGASLHQIYFGLSLDRSLTMFRAASQDGSRLDASAVSRITRIVSRRWAFTAIIRTLHALVLTNSMTEDGTPHSIWLKVLSELLLVSNIPITQFFHERMVNKKSKTISLQPGYEEARSISLSVGRNALFCVLPMAVSGLMIFLGSGMSAVVDVTTDQGTLHHVVRAAWSLVNGMLDSLEMITVASLVALLYQKFVKTALTITKYQTRAEMTSSNRGLFQVQTEFFTKMGNIFRTQLSFLILPYISPTATAIFAVYTTLDTIRGIFFP